MKFRVARDVLSEAIQWTARAVPNRPAVPILAGVRVAAAEGILELASFDYEISARSEVAVDVDTPGETLISGRLLAEITRALPNQDVTFTLSDGHAQIRCGNSEFNLPTMPLSDYPHVPALPEAVGTVDSAVFAEAIQQVVIAASKEEALPLLTATRIEIDGPNMTLLATDRYRLAMRNIEWNPISPDFKATLLVKSKVLTDVAKSMASSGEIDVFLSDGETNGSSSVVGFSAGGRQATSVLMDGDYPPVRKLFPDTTPLEYVCARQELLEAARRVSLVAERKTSVRLTFEEGAVRLEAGQGDTGQAQESVEVISGAEDLKTAFNPQFLQEGLGVIENDYVRFRFTSGSKAMVLQGQEDRDGEPDDNYRYLLMGLTLKFVRRRRRFGTFDANN